MTEKPEIETYPTVPKFPLSINFVAPYSHVPRVCHRHEIPEMVFILSGAATHMANGNECPIEAGDVLFLRAEDSHGYCDEKNMELVNLIFDPVHLPLPPLDGGELPLYAALSSGRHPDPPNAHMPVARLDHAELKTALERLHMLQTETVSEAGACRIAALALLMELLVMVSRHGSAKREHERNSLEDIIVMLRGNPAVAPDIDEWARRMYVSRRTFFRVFRRETGFAPAEFLRRRRAEYAAELLAQPRPPKLAEIALRCGFCDAAHLCKVFSNIHGMSPVDFRKRMLAGNDMPPHPARRRIRQSLPD